MIDICWYWVKHQRTALSTIPALGLLFLLWLWGLLFSRNCEVLNAIYRLIDGILDRFRHICVLFAELEAGFASISAALSQVVL
jgi:hypothetical protein